MFEDFHALEHSSLTTYVNKTAWMCGIKLIKIVMICIAFARIICERINKFEKKYIRIPYPMKI